jgi:transcription elongation factor Elf1
MIAVAVLFLIPAYYLGKSKGYNVTVLLVASVLFSLGIPLLVRFFEIIYLPPLCGYYFPALSLGIVWLLPKRKGAPGKKYLKIVFNCPECNEAVTFARSKEGNAELCPKCGEIITVLVDEFSPKPEVPKRVKPTGSVGAVCYATFSDEMLAAQLQALLKDGGVDSDVVSGIAGGALSYLGGVQGFKLSVHIDDWDKAVEIEKKANQNVASTSVGKGSFCAS